jgi:hypothetical protein
MDARYPDCEVKLTGTDGNAFAIPGRACRLDARWSVAGRTGVAHNNVVRTAHRTRVAEGAQKDGPGLAAGSALRLECGAAALRS